MNDEKGIRVLWYVDSRRQDKAILTFDQAREMYGLVGTPDSELINRIEVLKRQMPSIFSVTDEMQALAVKGTEKVNTLLPVHNVVPLPQSAVSEPAGWPPRKGDLWGTPDGAEWFAVHSAAHDGELRMTDDEGSAYIKDSVLKDKAPVLIRRKS